ncbi:glycosyltransferase family 61 protein [Shewanella maritima]|uniref:Glycosyltransferase family 61 protein n=1 Tax=Shewanella maritima TaxID=2520507 RepID=A0A411PE72_9GAMM|nr:glycosyltransferase family 61 protein [Shewanella maritima]QBF81866.1 glycosyltransferase family 61 protein [Shewanella maritima]
MNFMKSEWIAKSEVLLKLARENKLDNDTSSAEKNYLEALKYDYYSKNLREEIGEFYKSLSREVEAERVMHTPYVPLDIKTYKMSSQEEYHMSKHLVDKLDGLGLSPLYVDECSRSYTMRCPDGYDLLSESLQQHDVFQCIGTEQLLSKSTVRCYGNACFTPNGAFTVDDYYFKENRVTSGSFLRYVFFHPLLGFISDKTQKPDKVECDLGFVFQRHPMLNYYHLMVEQAPALLNYKRYLEPKGVKLIILRNNYEGLIKQILSLLSISESSVVWESARYIQCEYTYKQDAATNNCNQVVKFVTNSTVEFFDYLSLQHSVPFRVKKKRIFISREDSPKRTMKNEKQVFELLETFGFEKVILTGMSLTDQIRLFASSEAVVGAHGAGLTNIGFCCPGTFVLELTRTFTLGRLRIFWDLAIIKKLKYSVVCAEDSVNDHAAPFEAPVDKISELLSNVFVKNK